MLRQPIANGNSCSCLAIVFNIDFSGLRIFFLLGKSKQALQFGFHLCIHDERLESRNGRVDSTAALEARLGTTP